jgi:hypothetical protein
VNSDKIPAVVAESFAYKAIFNPSKVVWLILEEISFSACTNRVGKLKI